MKRRELSEEFRQDVAHGLRHFAHRPLFASAAVLTLALGIGAATAIFSAADHVLLRPLPYDDPARVVTLWETDVALGERRKGVAPGNFLDWMERNHCFSAIGLAEPFGFDLTAQVPPEPVTAWRVTQGFGEALGVRPILGRGFRTEDYVPESPTVVLMFYGAWQRRYGGDAGIVGRSIQLDRQPMTVIGVLPSWLEYPEPKEPREFWVPKGFRETELRDRTSDYMYAVARLRQGIGISQAQAEMDGIAAQLSSEHQRTNRNAGIRLVPLEEQLLGGTRPALLVLLGAVLFVLLIACANVAGLLLSRGAEREVEFGVRAALGAGRARLVRQLLNESLVLAIGGGAAGIMLARLGVRFFARMSPADLPRASTISIDERVLAVAFAVTIATALLFGVGPALRFSRPDVLATLRGASRSPGGHSRTGLRRILVVAEIALSLVLLIGAGLLARSFLRLLENDLGFAVERRVALQLFLWDQNPTPEQRRQRVAQIVERFQSTPGVQKVGVVSALPFHPHQIDLQAIPLIEGRPSEPGAEQKIFTTVATPEYFEVVGIPLRRGRPFTDQDRAETARVALVNETMARRFFPGEEAIGRRVVVGVMSRPVAREIIGIVGDVRPTSLDSDPRAELYIPFEQSGTGHTTFVVLVRTDPAAIIPDLRSQVWQIDPHQTIYHAATLEQLVSQTLVERRFHLTLVGSFSLLALVLATIGIYGLISFSITQRTHEIGLRVAVGASPSDVVRMIVVEGLRLGLMGVLIGIACALALTRFLQRMLYGVTPTDPVTFIQFAIVLLAITAMAAYLPARRAAYGDPASALRE